MVKFDHFKMNGGLPGFLLKLLNYYYYKPMFAAFLPALQPYKYFVYCIQTLCMETKQAAREEPSVFALIVDKLRYMDEAELKLAYIKLFRKELEEE